MYLIYIIYTYIHTYTCVRTIPEIVATFHSPGPSLVVQWTVALLTQLHEPENWQNQPYNVHAQLCQVLNVRLRKVWQNGLIKVSA